MKAHCEIKTGVPDDIDNDILMPGALKIPDKKIHVLKNFDASLNGIIGECTVTEKKGLIVIDADLNEDVPLDRCTFGIGYRITDAEFDRNGNKIIKDAELFSVGISGKRVDGTTIKQIYE